MADERELSDAEVFGQPKAELSDAEVFGTPKPAPVAPEERPAGDIDYGSAFLRGLARAGEGLVSTGSYVTGQGAIPRREWADEGQELDKPWNVFNDPLSLTAKKALYGIGEAGPFIAGLAAAAPVEGAGMMAGIGSALPEMGAEAAGVAKAASGAVPFLTRMAQSAGLPAFVARAAPLVAPAAGLSALQGLGENVAQDGDARGIARTGIEAGFSGLGMLPFGAEMSTPMRQFGTLLASQIGAGEAQQLAEPALMGEDVPSASQLMNELPQHAVNSLLPAMLGAIFHEPAKAEPVRPLPNETEQAAEQRQQQEKKDAEHAQMLEKLGYTVPKAAPGTREAPVDLQQQPGPQGRESVSEAASAQPTEAQREAGNYAKGHARFNGLDLSIETPEGAIREGTTPDGQHFSARMPYHYGYIKGTKGADGDHLDVTVGPDPKADTAYVINQMDPKTGAFDEHKIQLGFPDGQSAIDAYTNSFSDGSGAERIMSVTPMPVSDVKTLARISREKPLTEPIDADFTEHHPSEPIYDNGEFVHTATPEDLRNNEKFMRKALGEIRRIGGTEPDVEVHGALRNVSADEHGNENLYQHFGSFDPMRNLIRLSLERDAFEDGKWVPRTEDEKLAVAREEAGHSVWKLVKPDERSTLATGADEGKWWDRYKIKERYPRQPGESEAAHADRQLNEATMQAMSEGRLNRFKSPFIPEAVRPILKKLDDFLNRLASHARKVFGQKATAKDILAALDRGEVARRADAQAPDSVRLLAQGFRMSRADVRDRVERLGEIMRSMRMGEEPATNPNFMRSVREGRAISPQGRTVDEIMRDRRRAEALRAKEDRAHESDPANYKTAAEYVKAMADRNRWSLSDNPDHVRQFSPHFDFGDRQATKHIAIMNAGVPKGIISGDFKKNGNEFHVNWMNVRGGPHTVPTPAMRDLGKQLRKLLPEKTRDITGLRVSGARGANRGAAKAKASLKSFSIGRKINEWPEKVETRAEKVEKDPKFKSFFKGSWVVDAAGKPKIVFHFTPKDIGEAFDRRYSTREGNMGAGFYFTNDPWDGWNNYGAHGPDVKNKIAAEMDRLRNHGEEPDVADQAGYDARESEIQRQAHAKYVEHEGFALPVFLAFRKPIILGKSMDNPKQTPTFLDTRYRANTIEGPMVDVLDGVRKAASQKGVYDVDPNDLERLLNATHESFPDGGSAELVMNYLMGSGDSDHNMALAYATDHEGNLIGREIMRQGFHNAGFDGIIDNTVSQKFQGMGLAPNATHYIAFRPAQVKGLFNRGTWNPRDNRLLFSKGKPLIGEDSSPFYSQLEKEIGDAKQKKASGEQWLQYLRNRPGVKAEELEATGIKDFLEDHRDQPVTKDELQQMMNQGALRMFEVVRGPAWPELKTEDAAAAPKEVEVPEEVEGPDRHEEGRFLDHITERRLDDAVENMSSREIDQSIDNMLEEEEENERESVRESLYNNTDGSPWHDYDYKEIEIPEIVTDEGHEQHDLLTGEKSTVGRKVEREGRIVWVATHENKIADDDWDQVSSLRHIDPENPEDDELQEIHDAIESGKLTVFDSKREAERALDNNSSRQDAESEWMDERENEVMNDWYRRRRRELRDSYEEDYRERERDSVRDQVQDEYDNGDLEYDPGWEGRATPRGGGRDLRPTHMPTKWDTHQLKGPVKNYREIVFTLPGLMRKYVAGEETFVPPEGVDRAQMADAMHQARNRIIESRDHDDHSELTNGQVLAEMNKGINDPDRLYQLKKGQGRIDKSKEKFFYTTHFPEEDMVMHNRSGERYTTDGDFVLVSDENQSDIAQQGRDRGYKSDSPEYKATMKKRLEKAEQVEGELRGKLTAARNEVEVFADSYREFQTRPEGSGDPIIGYELVIGPEGARFDKDVDHVYPTEEAANAAAMEQSKKYTDTDFEVVPKRQRAADFEKKLDQLERRRDQVAEQLHKAATKRDEIKSAIEHPSVPDAPFKETYYELVLNRMLQLAAQHGYDGFGWTSGKVQSIRWSQATHFNRIDVKKVPEGFELSVWKRDGYQARNDPGGYNPDRWTDEYLQSVGNNSRPDATHLLANADELKNALGKELYFRALKQMDTDKTDHAKLIGNDLVTPSEGFTVNYDEKQVNYVNSKIKKFGLKVGKAEVPVEDNGASRPWLVVGRRTSGTVEDRYGFETQADAEGFLARQLNDGLSRNTHLTYSVEPAPPPKTETIHYVRFKGAEQEKQLREALGKQQKILAQGNPIGGASTGPVPPPGPKVNKKFMQRVIDAIPERTREYWRDIGRDMQKLATPMAVNAKEKWMDPYVQQWRARAKDWANGKAYIQWKARSDIASISKRFTTAQQRLIYDAMDEEGRARRLTGQPAPAGKGLTRLNPEERALAEKLDQESAAVIAQLIQAGKLDKNFQRIPYWVPRILHEMSQEGPYKLPSGDPEMAGDWNNEGRNFKTTSPHLLHRKYDTIEETEAAAQQGLRKNVRVIRDVRAHVIAMANVRDALAGTHVINELKALQKSIGRLIVVDDDHPVFKTIPHPSFYEWKPKMEKDDQGNWYGVKDQETGEPVFERVPFKVHEDFEGPLRAILSQDTGAVYKGLMALKGKTMGLIMYSPIIHNAVEWGRALPAAPLKVMSGLIYRDGWRAQRDESLVREAILNGLRPIGGHGGMQDIDAILQQRAIEPGASWTAQILGKVGDIFSQPAGDAVRRGIDAAGNFWHNTLLWDQVRALQFGLYTNFLDHLLKKGVDRQTASRTAAEFANVYAGSMPMESMSTEARKIANLMLFSRSFTLGNIAAMKTIFTGLSRGVKSQILRDQGEHVLGVVNSMAKRKALGILIADIGLYYIANSLVQSSINVMSGRNDLNQEMQEYVDRLVALAKDDAGNPIHLLNPDYQLNHLMSTYYNEPGKQDRILVGHDKDGTGIYARNPAGKIGEEFVGWISNPVKMITKKLGTLVKPTLELINNDKGFGRKLYDPYADTPEGWVRNMGRIAWNYVGQQVPVESVQGAWRAATEPNARAIEGYKALGPFAGVTFSSGAPGGPAVGQLWRAKDEYQMRVQDAMPDIRDAIRNGRMNEAVQSMLKLGMSPGLIQFYIKTTLNPALRLNPRALQQFMQTATPEEIAQMQRLLQ